MKQDKTETQDQNQPVDSKRRKLITNLIAGGVALTSVSAAALAAERQGKGKGGKGKGGKGKGRQGEQGRGQGAGQQQDHAAIAADLIKEFDKDGDNALNARELAAALRSAGQRRGGMQGRERGERAGKGGKGKSQRGSAKTGTGVTPKRPDSQ